MQDLPRTGEGKVSASMMLMMLSRSRNNRKALITVPGLAQGLMRYVGGDTHECEHVKFTIVTLRHLAELLPQGTMFVMDSPGCLDWIVRVALRRPSPETEYEAVRALSELCAATPRLPFLLEKRHGVVPIFVRAIKDAEMSTKSCAVVALNRLSGSTIPSGVIELDQHAGLLDSLLRVLQLDGEADLQLKTIWFLGLLARNERNSVFMGKTPGLVPVVLRAATSEASIPSTRGLTVELLYNLSWYGVNTPLGKTPGLVELAVEYLNDDREFVNYETHIVEMLLRFVQSPSNLIPLCKTPLLEALLRRLPALKTNDVMQLFADFSRSETCCWRLWKTEGLIDALVNAAARGTSEAAFLALANCAKVKVLQRPLFDTPGLMGAVVQLLKDKDTDSLLTKPRQLAIELLRNLSEHDRSIQSDMFEIWELVPLAVQWSEYGGWGLLRHLAIPMEHKAAVFADASRVVHLALDTALVHDGLAHDKRDTMMFLRELAMDDAVRVDFACDAELVGKMLGGVRTAPADMCADILAVFVEMCFSSSAVEKLLSQPDMRIVAWVGSRLMKEVGEETSRESTVVTHARLLLAQLTKLRVDALRDVGVTLEAVARSVVDFWREEVRQGRGEHAVRELRMMCRHSAMRVALAPLQSELMMVLVQSLARALAEEDSACVAWTVSLCDALGFRKRDAVLDALLAVVAVRRVGGTLALPALPHLEDSGVGSAASASADSASPAPPQDCSLM